MASLGERMVGAMKGDAATFEEIERDQSAMGQAVTVIIIAGVAALIGNLFRSGITAGVFALIASLVMYAVWAVIVTGFVAVTIALTLFAALVLHRNPPSNL